jgi:hypothetical protein
LSRSRFIVLLLALAALAAGLAACGGGSSSDSDPQEVIDGATLEGVESGKVDLSLHVKAEGEEGGDIDVSLSGPFQGAGPESLPQLDMKAKVNGEASGEKLNFDGGLTLLSDRAFIEYKGTEYEVDPTTFGFVKSGFEQAEQEGGAEGQENTACQKAATELKVGEFVDNLKNEGSEDVDGESTTKVSGDLNVKGAIDAIIKLTENPACSSSLAAAGPLPLEELEKIKGEVGSAVKKAHADVYVGDDGIVRKVDTELTIEPKTGEEKVELEFELTLSEVNEEQDIAAPKGAKPLEGLFQELGVNPLELLEAGSGGGDIGSLLEGLGGSSSGTSGEEPSSGSAGSVAGQQAYLECLEGVETPTDLQKCASELK